MALLQQAVCPVKIGAVQVEAFRSAVVKFEIGRRLRWRSGYIQGAVQINQSRIATPKLFKSGAYIVQKTLPDRPILQFNLQNSLPNIAGVAIISVAISRHALVQIYIAEVLVYCFQERMPGSKKSRHYFFCRQEAFFRLIPISLLQIYTANIVVPHGKAWVRFSSFE